MSDVTTLDERVRVTPDGARTLLLNSSVAAVLGAALMVLVHELIHLVTGVALGSPSTLYPYGVTQARELSSTEMAIAAISAPVFSLICGVVMTRWQPLAKAGGFAQLLWLWFAFTSIMEGVGYLVITPFGAGDTAVTAQSLGWPAWVQILIAVAGVGLMFVVARMFTPYLPRYAGADRPRLWGLAFWPWLIASGVTMTLAFFYVTAGGMKLTAGETMAVLMAGNAVFVFAPMSFMFIKRVGEQEPRPLGLPAVPVGGIIGLVVLIGVNIALLGGLRLG